MTDNKYPV